MDGRAQGLTGQRGAGGAQAGGASRRLALPRLASLALSRGGGSRELCSGLIRQAGHLDAQHGRLSHVLTLSSGRHWTATKLHRSVALVWRYIVALVLPGRSAFGTRRAGRVR